MIFSRLLAPGEARRAGRALAESAARQGRAPFLYADLGAPDSVQGRFEILTLHVILLSHRLGGSETGQALFDAYLSDLDGALREMGFGDLSVGKRMRGLGEAFYGRARAWTSALATLPDESEIDAVIARTVLADRPDVEAAGLTAYVHRCRAALAAQGDAAFKLGEVAWPTR